MRIYLSGPIEGMPNRNDEAFAEAKIRLEGLGHEVRSPKDNAPPPEGYTGDCRPHWMLHDLRMIIGDKKVPPVDVLAVLPGWENSRGSLVEVEVALQLGIEIIHAEDLSPVSDDALMAAAAGHRLGTYLRRVRRAELVRSLGVELITAERRRQIDGLGWTPEHDDAHQRQELLEAAIAYAREASLSFTTPTWPPDYWPWTPADWKPSENPVRNLEKAGALLAAEIDRLLRQLRDQ